MSWSVDSIQLANGRYPVKELVNGLQRQTQSKIPHFMALLRERGSNLGMPYTKKIDRQIYELRIIGREEVRIFFSVRDSMIWLLHGYKKKTQKMPVKELKIAQERLKLIA